MAKLVVLSPGMTGRAQELKTDKTTIGRFLDNTFQIDESSVSSHHCEILVRGNDIVVKDLNSTNGTFINGEKVVEAPIKPGQILRVGMIEIRLDNDAPPRTRNKFDETTVIRGGVNRTELEAGVRPDSFQNKGTGPGFSKKDDRPTKIVIIACAILGVVIVGLLLYVFAIANK
ncbi:MAG TPA: FHA domain-containing protein [Verrucomicrobiae bacterium]|nr:FHA domain-containing protein [Verrucomicrobiae bacterium]